MQLGRFKNRTPARFEYIYCTLFPLLLSMSRLVQYVKTCSVCQDLLSKYVKTYTVYQDMFSMSGFVQYVKVLNIKWGENTTLATLQTEIYKT
jgi:hypothetical protein